MIHHGEVHALRPGPGHGFSPWSMASAKVLFRHRFKCSKFKIEVQKAKEKVRQTTRQTGSNTYPPKLEKRSLQTGKTFFSPIAVLAKCLFLKSFIRALHGHRTPYHMESYVTQASRTGCTHPFKQQVLPTAINKQGHLPSATSHHEHEEINNEIMR